MSKRKAECTPEEWETIRKRARQYDAKYRLQPERKQYMQKYMQDYIRSETYRERDNARYCDGRRAAQLAAFRKRKYGATSEDVERLRALQGNRCAACSRVLAQGKSQASECLDHCHETGRVRGLLCRMCNTFEGFLRKAKLTPSEYAKRLEHYLAHPPSQEEVLW